MQGTVVAVHSGGLYRVQCDAGHEVLAQLSGRMRRFRIKVVPGDRVTVGVSPVRSRSRHHHVPRAVDPRIYVRRSQYPSFPSRRGRRRWRRRCQSRPCSATTAAAGAEPPEDGNPLRLLRAPRRPADGRHHRLRPEAWCPDCAFYKVRRIPKKRAPQDSVRISSGTDSGLWSRDLSPATASSSLIPKTPCASSTHSPSGESCWYARQCGFASTDCPIFSSVIAR